MTQDKTALPEGLTRPIIGIEHRTAQEVFDIMSDRIRTALRSIPPDDGWRTIDSAPKDGTRILLGGATAGPTVRIGAWGGGRYLGARKGYEQGWIDHPGHSCDPTHWRPLPPPPEAV